MSALGKRLWGAFDASWNCTLWKRTNSPTSSTSEDWLSRRDKWKREKPPQWGSWPSGHSSFSTHFMLKSWTHGTSFPPIRTVNKYLVCEQSEIRGQGYIWQDGVVSYTVYLKSRISQLVEIRFLLLISQASCSRREPDANYYLPDMH